MDQVQKLQKSNKRLKEMVTEAITLQKAADADNVMYKEQIAEFGEKYQSIVEEIKKVKMVCMEKGQPEQAKKLNSIEQAAQQARMECLKQSQNGFGYF